MTTFSTGDNRFGPTPFIVGTTLGDGCNYTSIQTAINDCSAAGGGVVYIRPGAYVENLSLLNHVDIHGVSVDGRLPGTFAEVEITGNHTYSPLAGTNIVIIENISFDAAAGDIFTVTPPAGVFSVLGLKYCGIFASGGRAIFSNPAATGFVQLTSLNSMFESSGVTFDALAGFTTIGLTQIEATSSLAEVIALGDSTSSSEVKDSLLTSSASYGITAQGANVLIEWSRIGSSLSCVYMPSGNLATLTSYHNTYESNDPSTFYVDDAGQGSMYRYADDVITGTATDYQFSISVQPWRPRAGYGFGPPPVLDPRGVACFEFTQFTVTDGFVELKGSAVPSSFVTDSGTATPALGIINILGGPGVTTSAAGNTVTVNSVVWTTHVGPATVGVDTGSFDAGPTTLTLPVAPLQGEECRFASTSGATVIQASGAQKIRIGNIQSSGGGTATATSAGDTLWLTYYAGNDQWFSVATNGNWTLA